ncbi:hypothetical protein J7K07_05520 [Candidatus Bathyarchaeota archaeon]|nr:hypothetical protein [Candidatus Bathyarchaeota archaeon]
MNTKNTSFLIDLLFIVALGVIVSYINIPMWSGGMPGWCDNYGHAEKIWFTAESLKHYGKLPSWDPYWLCGYPIHQFYPPFSYFVAALITIIFNNVYIGYILALEGASFLGGVFTYIYMRRVVRNHFAAFISAVYFALNPFFFGYSVWLGAFPIGFGTMIFIPLAFLCFEEILKEGWQIRHVIPLSIVLALSILTHIFAFLIICYTLLFMWLFRTLIIRTEQSIKSLRILLKLGLSIFLSIGLSAFWLLPAYIMKNRMITYEYTKMWWEHLTLSSLPNRIGVYHIIFALLSLIFILIRRKWTYMPYLLTSAICMLWSLGKNSPYTWWFFLNFPLANFINPVRFSVMIDFLLSVVIGANIVMFKEFLERKGSYKRVRIFKSLSIAALFILLLYPLIIESQAYAKACYSANKPASDYIEICKMLRSYPNHRVEGSVFSPVWHGKPIRIGFPESSQIPWFWIRVWRNYIPEGQKTDFLMNLYRIMDVAYIISSDDSSTIKPDSNCKMILSRGKYKVYQIIPPPKYTKPIKLGKVLVVSRYIQAVNGLNEMMPHLRSILVKLEGDPSLEDLKKYDVILMYGYDSRPSMDILLSLLKEGKTIIVDTYNSIDEEGELFGVKSIISRSHDHVEWNFTEEGRKFLMNVNVSGFSKPEWMGNPWEYTIYKGLDEVYAYADGNPVLGVKNIEHGKVVFVGFNFFLHMMYHYNYEEAKLLGNIINYFSTGSICELPVDGYAKLIHREPEKIIIEYNTSAPYIFVSEAYYPAWNVIIDGSKSAKIYSYLSLMAVKVPSGKHTLTLYFSMQWYDYVGIVISSITAITMMMFLVREILKGKGALAIQHGSRVSRMIERDVSVGRVSEKKFKTTNTLIDILIIVAVTSSIILYYFRGPTSGPDVSMHLSRVRIIMSSFPVFPRWNPYWYFGVPFLRVYSGGFHYSLALLGLLISRIFPSLSTSEIISLSITIYTPLIFSIGAVSLYFLARELDLPRFGAVSAALLFVTSYNLYSYWATGSYPNISSLLLSPLPLALYIKGLSKKKLSYALLTGLAYGIMTLTYLPNAICLVIFFVLISIFMTMRHRELLLIPRTGGQPPKYTLTIFKFAVLSAVSAFASSAWWLIPFYVSTRMSSATITKSVLTSIVTPISLPEAILNISGISGFTITTPGICHFTLIFLSTPFFIKARRRRAIWSFYMTIFSLIFHLFVRCTGYGISFIPSGRFTLFFALFGSIAGGFALSALLQSYTEILSSYYRSKTTLTFFIGLMVLSSVVSSLIISIDPFSVTHIPPWNDALDHKVELGERVGTSMGYDLNLKSNVWQSGGGSIESMYILNEFAYKFWYYVLYKKDIRYLPYFSRNYNVRYFLEMLKGLKKTDMPGLYEFPSFKSSIVEIVPKRALLIFHVGPKSHYSYLFTSIALSGDTEPIIVDGGEYLEDFTSGDLKHFDLIYISDILVRNENTYVSLIDSYLRNGGVVLFDMGDIPSMLPSKVADLIPVKGMVKGTSNLKLKFSSALGDIKYSPFKDVKAAQILYAKELKGGAEIIAWDENNNSLMVRMKKYNGWIIWSGMSLPYQIMRIEDPEGAHLLVYLMRFFTSHTSTSIREIRSGDLKILSTDEYEVDLSGLSADDAVWFKMTYYPGWEAIVKNTGERLKIFLAGPHTMLVFPQRSSTLKIIFKFGKTLDVIIGEYASIIFYGISFLYLIPYQIIRKHYRPPEGWVHTRHKGLGYEAMNMGKRNQKNA